MRVQNFVILAVGLLSLAACQSNDLKKPAVPLGDFALGVNVAIAEGVQKSPVSRTAEPEELEASMKKAVSDRFDRYSGSRLFNIGVSIDGYALGPAGIPVLLSPPSVMIVTVSVFEDATGKKLNPEGERMTIIEKSSPQTFIGSGLTQNKKQQMDNLSYNVAKRIEIYLLEHPQWIGMTEAEAKAALAQSAGTPKAAETAPAN